MEISLLDEKQNPIKSTNPLPVLVAGSVFQEQLSHADATAGVLAFSEVISAIEIHNTDAVNAGVFTVNGIAIAVPAETSFPRSLIGGIPSDEVTITGSTTYIVNRYK